MILCLNISNMKVSCLYVICIVVGVSNAHLNKKLRYFEIIHSSNVKHQISKRNDDDAINHVREITLSAFGRTLSLELKRKTSLFSRQFQAVTIDSNGNEIPCSFNQNEFYKGHLKGEKKKSFISAQIHDNLLTASIETENDTYHIEPAFGHIDGDTSEKMIAYRDSDVNWNVTFSKNHTENERFCGLNANDNENYIEPRTLNVSQGRHNTKSSRNRRYTRTHLRCELALVADYLYYVNIGQKNRMKTIQSMVGTIHRVDEIFRKTDFSDDPRESYKNFGFVIKKVVINEQPSSTGYNLVLKHGPWKTESLLQAFSKHDWSDYCLAHLFTYQDFVKGVIGLAYVAKERYGSKRGICSKSDQGLYHNTGLSSSENWGSRLLTTEADIVTAHELGHNFGSEHDIANYPTCSPDEGKYIMYPAAVSGRKPNNKDFSLCSKQWINKVLETKSDCFVMPDEGEFCGNFRVEGDEQCDGGPEGDQCCTRDCEFHPGAICSDSNFKTQCCSNCKFANNSVLCSAKEPLLCQSASYCDGKSAVCAHPKPIKSGTECIERGRCDKNGECIEFCHTLNPPLQACLCSNDEDACYVCCQTDSGCNVYKNGSKRLGLTNGRLCLAGVCNEQKCKKNAQDFITRLKDFFVTLSDPSKFGEFLKVNIVGTVIFFSLLGWIPLSIVVHRIDKRRDKHAQELARWQDVQNNELILEQNRKRDFDVVFKKNSVWFRDSIKCGRGLSQYNNWINIDKTERIMLE